MDVRDVLARKAAAAFARVFGVKPCGECTTPKECRSRLRTARRDVFTEYFAGHLILDEWNPDLESLLMYEYELCGGCSTGVFSRDHDARNEVWDGLPDILGIEVKGWGLEPEWST